MDEATSQFRGGLLGAPDQLQCWPGNLLSVTDARNNVTSYTYNTMDRLATRTDPLRHQESYQYDGNGNLMLSQRTRRAS